MKPNTPETFWARVAEPDEADGCRPWTGGHSSNGYGCVNYQGRVYGAHRLAWILTHGPIPAGMCVCHRCDNKQCCRPDHLFLGAPAVNSADMAAKGRARSPRGTARPQSKLTAGQVREMRRRYAAGGVSSHQLAREFGVSSMVAWRAIVGRSYKDVA